MVSKSPGQQQGGAYGMFASGIRICRRRAVAAGALDGAANLDRSGPHQAVRGSSTQCQDQRSVVFFAYSFLARESDMLGAIKALGRFIAVNRMGAIPAAMRFWPGIVIATFALALTCG